MNIKKLLLGLSVAAVATAGIVIPQAAAPQSASAMNVCKTTYTYQRVNSVTCALTPSNPACVIKVKHVTCTRY